MRAAAQCAVEGVRVPVGQAGQGQPGQPLDTGGWLRPGPDGGDAVPVDLEEDVGLGPVAAEPGVLGQVRGHRHARSSSTVASARMPATQSSGSACSAGLWLTPVALRTKSIAVGTCAARTPAS